MCLVEHDHRAYLSINTSIQAARVLIPCCSGWSDTAEHTDVTLEVLDFIVKLAVLLNCVSILACHVLKIIHLSMCKSGKNLHRST